MSKKVPCQVYSRVVGYISMVQQGDYIHWNPGKYEEWKERETYSREGMIKDVQEKREGKMGGMLVHSMENDVGPAPLVFDIRSERDRVRVPAD